MVSIVILVEIEIFFRMGVRLQDTYVLNYYVLNSDFKYIISNKNNPDFSYSDDCHIVMMQSNCVTELSVLIG